MAFLPLPQGQGSLRPTPRHGLVRGGAGWAAKQRRQVLPLHIQLCDTSMAGPSLSTDGSLNSVLSRERMKNTTLDYVGRDRATQTISVARDEEKSSLSQTFGDKASRVSKADRIRSEMRDWRKRNPDRDFGREL